VIEFQFSLDPVTDKRQSFVLFVGMEATDTIVQATMGVGTVPLEELDVFLIPFFLLTEQAFGVEGSHGWNQLEG
jgi:hypothetical protein